MTTSIDRDDGTSNSDRISAEVAEATLELRERFPGYRRELTIAATECYVLTAENDEQRMNINQRYDEVIKELARKVSQKTQAGE